LEHILSPSRIVAPEFKTTMVTLLDDTELIGFVQRQTADEFVLRDESLAEHRIKRNRVRESRESTLSAMPEGLLAPLTAQEAADLLEYICATNPPPK
jgi:putative heme-binding domain-containing protein